MSGNAMVKQRFSFLFHTDFLPPFIVLLSPFNVKIPLLTKWKWVVQCALAPQNTKPEKTDNFSHSHICITVDPCCFEHQLFWKPCYVEMKHVSLCWCCWVIYIITGFFKLPLSWTTSGSHLHIRDGRVLPYLAMKTISELTGNWPPLQPLSTRVLKLGLNRGCCYFIEC